MFALTQRTREVGIRMALGATAGAVVRLIVGQTMRLAAIGGALGLVIAYATLNTLNSLIQLERVSLVDASAFGVAVLVIVSAVAAAAFVPARRATRIDPARNVARGLITGIRIEESVRRMEVRAGASAPALLDYIEVRALFNASAMLLSASCTSLRDVPMFMRIWPSPPRP
jgi:predicted lysophospholipase L1 biosynthesis ABC-type transport system permease subunit